MSEAKVERLLARLRAPDAAVRADAAWRLVRGRAEAARPGLHEALRDHDAHVRMLAAWALSRLGGGRLAA